MPSSCVHVPLRADAGRLLPAQGGARPRVPAACVGVAVAGSVAVAVAVAAAVGVAAAVDDVGCGPGRGMMLDAG